MTHTEEVFANPDQTKPQEPTANPFEELVGEGKKFADPVALAKAKMESDAFIEQLKSENAELRNDLNARPKTEDILAALRDELKSEDHSSRENTTPELDAGKVNDLVRQQLEQHEADKAVRSNMDKAADEMYKIYGDKSKDAIDAKASELGMSVQDLHQIAARSPSAFMQFFRPQGSSSSSNLPKSTVNTTTLMDGKKPEDVYGSKAYWSAKKKELGARFHDPKIQQERFQNVKDGLYI